MSEKQETYQCKACGQEKPIAQFYKNNTRLGHEKHCKSCRLARNRQNKQGVKGTVSNGPITPKIEIDLSKYPALLKKLHEKATREFRTPSQQAAFVLHQALVNGN